VVFGVVPFAVWVAFRNMVGGSASRFLSTLFRLINFW